MVLFHRDFRGLTGGHLKVGHWLRHVAASPRYHPGVYLTPASRRDDSNPFFTGGRDWLQPSWRPEMAEALFVAGLDWLAVPAGWNKPIVNLVQGVRHAGAGDPRRRFLGRRAVRICVSGEVADAITATGEVNGPVITIPNAIEVPVAAGARADRSTPLLLAGWKDAALTAAVTDRLRGEGFAPEVIAAPLPRKAFLDRLASARVVVFLPLAEEGCFLPALEAFALGCLVVCPDCIGNRRFCRDGETCLRPHHDPGSIVAAVKAAMAMAPADRERIVAAAAVEAAGHGLEGECRAFLEILDNLPGMW